MASPSAACTFATQLGAAALQGCSAALHLLVELTLEGCTAGGSRAGDCSGWDAVFSCLLAQAPHLTHLAFSPASAPPGGGLLAALAARAGELSRLELEGLAPPTGLPAGPYLAGEPAR